MEHDAHNEIITLKSTEKGVRFGGHNMIYNEKFVLLLFVVQLSFAQSYWQQHVEYEMDITMDVSDFTLTENKSWYTPITLRYNNQGLLSFVFQRFSARSQMDTRSRTIKDPTEELVVEF